MSIRTIVAVLHEDGDTERVLDVALPMAERFDSHLIGVHAAAIPLPIGSPLGFPDADFVQAGLENAEERAAMLKAAFDARSARAGRPAEWRSSQSLTADAARDSLATARASDLVIAQQTKPDEGIARYPDNAALLFETGRPLLVVPHAGPVDTTFARILVAWNGTPESARAAFDALPFIKEAAQTEILSVDPHTDSTQDGPVSGADIAEALARHGAKVTLSTRRSEGASAGETIRNHIADTEASLLVMGAYSQSWLREFFFGGATRTLLSSMQVATLMSR